MKNILFIHGAWGGAWEFEEFVSSLAERSHRPRAIDLPGHGQNEAPISEVTMEAYVSRVIEEVNSINGPVVLVGSSLAGAIISQVAERIPQEIERLVYIAAALPKSGESVLGLMQSDKEGQLLPQVVFSDDQSFATLQQEVVESILLHDVREPERVASLSPNFAMKQATEPFMAQVTLTEEAFGVVPKVYIRATLDKAMSLALQDRMITSWEVEQVFTLQSGHLPMMSQPEHFLEIINEVVGTAAVTTKL